MVRTPNWEDTFSTKTTWSHLAQGCRAVPLGLCRLPRTCGGRLCTWPAGHVRHSAMHSLCRCTRNLRRVNICLLQETVEPLLAPGRTSRCPRGPPFPSADSSCTPASKPKRGLLVITPLIIRGGRHLKTSPQTSALCGDAWPDVSGLQRRAGGCGQNGAVQEVSCPEVSVVPIRAEAWDFLCTGPCKDDLSFNHH